MTETFRRIELGATGSALYFIGECQISPAKETSSKALPHLYGHSNALKEGLECEFQSKTLNKSFVFFLQPCRVETFIRKTTFGEGIKKR